LTVTAVEQYSVFEHYLNEKYIAFFIIDVVAVLDGSS
jgi:hypothetical protein